MTDTALGETASSGLVPQRFDFRTGKPAQEAQPQIAPKDGATGEGVIVPTRLSEVNRQAEDGGEGQPGTGRTLATGAIRGAYEGTGALAGAAMLAPAGAPFGPLGVGAAALTGLVLGGTAAGEIASFAGVPKEEDIPKELRPAFIGGRAFGGSIVPGSGVITLARSGVRAGKDMVGSWVNRILDSIASKPKIAIALEILGASGAGAGGATAELVEPGDPGVRAAGELFGSMGATGMMPMTRLAISGADKIAGLVMGKGPADQRAGRIIYEAVKDHGGDPQALIEALRAGDEIGGLTAARKAESPALLGLQKSLEARVPAFAQDAAKQQQNAFDGVRAAIRLLEGDGSPQALADAAALRKDYFDTLLDSHLERFRQRMEFAAREAGESMGAMPGSASPDEILSAARRTARTREADASATLAEAERGAASAASAFGRDPQENRLALSKMADGAANEILSGARATEKELWEAVPKNIPVIPSEFGEALAGARRFMSAAEQLPKFIEDFASLVSGQRPGSVIQVPSGELVKFRSDLLAYMRTIARNPERAKEVSAVSQLAQAVLRDLETIPDVTGTLRQARDFTRSLHDSFTRSFAIETRSVDSSGARATDPELLLRDAFSSNADLAAIRTRELENATSFMARMGKGEATDQQISVMAEAQERYLRLLLQRKVIGPDGLAKPDAVSKALKDDAPLLERFPTIKADLQSAAKAARGLKDLAKSLGSAQKDFDASAVGRLAGEEDPARAVGRMLAGPSPVADIGELAALAGRTGVPKDSIRAAAWEWIVRQSADDNGDVSPERLLRVLTRTTAGRPALADTLVDSGLFDAPQVAGLRSSLENAVSAKTVYERAVPRIDHRARRVERESIIAALLDRDSPIQAVADLLKRNPASNLERLTAAVRRMGPDAEDGLVNALLRHAVGDGAFAGLQARLFEPAQPGLPSLADLMVANKLITPEHAGKIRALAEAGAKLEFDAAAPVDLSVLDPKGTMLENLVRSMGVRIGGVFAAGIGEAQSLHIRSAFSNWALKLFRKMRREDVAEVLIAAMKNPRHAADLMEEGATFAPDSAKGQRLNAFLYYALGESARDYMDW